MNKTDVLVIGSSAAGLVAATSAKKSYPDKEVCVVNKMPKTLIPCGIPYIFGTVNSSDNNILPAEKMFEANKIQSIHDEVISIDKENKRVHLKNGEAITYHKLIIATGSLPILPKWLPGADKKNVFTVPKDKEYLDDMQKKLENSKKIIVIGAGFIGVEISDELKKAGKEILLIEKLPHILGLAFDEDISIRAENVLKERGIEIITGISVKEICGDDLAQAVVLENGEKIPCDAVILALGYSPNVSLAKEAGIKITEHGFISVDEYMRSEEADIFAVGDCAEKRDFFTRKPSMIMLASTACAEARIAGMNLYRLSTVKTFGGTISIFSTALGNTGFGVAGLTECIAKKEGFEIVTGIFEGIDRHPGAFTDTHSQFVKLVVAKDCGVILGGETFGGTSVGELTNMIGIIIENKMTIHALLTAQIGTHPLLTASPAGYPLIKAAENALQKM
jgi:NADH oxidase (H2O2-forming)